MKLTEVVTSVPTAHKQALRMSACAVQVALVSE